MDNPAVYGPQACRLTFAEAARRGIICGNKITNRKTAIDWPQKSANGAEMLTLIMILNRMVLSPSRSSKTGQPILTNHFIFVPFVPLGGYSNCGV